MKKALYTFVLFVILVVVFGVFDQASKKSFKSKRLACQDKTTTFERIFVESPIEKSVELFKSNQLNISSNIEYSTYMKSHLKDVYSLDKLNNTFNKSLKKYINSNSKDASEKININYYIYENDKKDQGKKSEKAKLYAGYFMLEISLKNKEIYKIQTDYMNIDGNDIEERVDCAIKSFITLTQ